MSSLRLGAQPRSGQRRLQIVAAVLFLLAFCVFCEAIVDDDGQMEVASLVAIGCLAAATFAAATFSGIVGLFGCDDCVSRL
jgi:hypothetical protein